MGIARPVERSEPAEVTLRQLLHHMYLLTLREPSRSSTVRAQGFVEGYMRALAQSGSMCSNELKRVVAEEHIRVFGDPRVS